MAPKVCAIFPASIKAMIGIPKRSAMSAADGWPVEQTHHALDQDQIRIGCSTRQAPAGISFAAHAEIEVLARAATGESMYLRVKKIRAALENSDPSALPAMQVPGRR